MKVDIKVPDNSEQIQNLQNLLQIQKPSNEDIALVMLLSSLIFFENRPGKLRNLPGYFIHGTGCHNPTSEKTKKIIWGIWRVEVTIDTQIDSNLHIKYELMNGGYLKAVLNYNGIKSVVTADILIDAAKNDLVPRSISIEGEKRELLMDQLNKFLKEPLDALLIVNNQLK